LRLAIAGRYNRHKQTTFPSNLLVKGQNTIALKLVNVKDDGGVMYDAIKLEAQ
jgi:rhamnogalacturonan endolyase